MNERIRELAKDAGYYLYDLTETHECKTVETDSADEWITLEKFAELIVKETITEMSQQLYWHGEDQSNNPSFYKAIDKTKKHFGVEQ